MSMFRSASNKPGKYYERLGEELASGSSDPNEEFKRSTSVPSFRGMAMASSSSSSSSASNSTNSNFVVNNNILQRNPTTKKKSHPLLSFLDFGKRKKKSTARPEITRYIEYVKEGGMWDLDSNKPVIYYK